MGQQVGSALTSEYLLWAQYHFAVTAVHRCRLAVTLPNNLQTKLTGNEVTTAQSKALYTIQNFPSSLKKVAEFKCAFS